MIQVDIDRWRNDPHLVARIHAAARRERTEMMHRFLARFGAWLTRTRHRARTGTECIA